MAPWYAKLPAQETHNIGPSTFIKPGWQQDFCGGTW